MKKSLVALLLVAGTLHGGDAAAFDLVDDDRVTARLGAGVRGGLDLQSDGDEVAIGPRLRYARLNAFAEYHGLGSLFVNLEAASGTVRLLDAEGLIRLSRCLTWHIGRYKAPVSYEFLIPALRHHWNDRLFATRLAPGRLNGTALRFARELSEDASIQAELGVYDADETGVTADGDLLVVGRVLAAPIAGLELHVGFANTVDRDDEPDTYGYVVDTAVGWRHGGYSVLAEAAVSVGEVDAGDERPWSVGGLFSADIGTDAAFDVGPRAGVDMQHREDGVDVYRARLGLGLPFHDAPILIGLDTHLTWTDGELSEGGFLFGQVKL